MTRAEAQSFDRLAETYDRLGELLGDVVGDWLPDVMPERGGRALDLGCGAGRHAVVLAERFDQVDAIDLSGPMIRLARRKCPRPNITYFEANILDIDTQYDFILSAMTLHHLADLPARARLPRQCRSSCSPPASGWIIESATGTSAGSNSS